MSFTRGLVLLWVLFWHAGAIASGLPARASSAISGSELVRRIDAMPFAEREAEIRAQFAQGNVPGFWRKFVDVRVTRMIDGRDHTVVYRVAPDYLVIGSDDDYFLAPVSPGTAQAIADSVDCTLPTRRMVDDIYAAAAVKLTPSPLAPGPAMTTVAVFGRHNQIVRQQRVLVLAQHPAGALVAGHRKDIVLTPQLADAPGKVAIYGWHRTGGKAIQPLYLGHTTAWLDYSHGARLVQRVLRVDGKEMTIDAVLADPFLAALLSDEGPFPLPRYGPASTFPREQVDELTFGHGVRAVLNAPAVLRDGKPLRLVLYAAPAGNTIEQTFGRRAQPGDDWHFDIQHIAAQTRWLRCHADDADLVVACLQCEQKSWPAWRQKFDPDNSRIAQIVSALGQRYPGRGLELVLSGHSAGGSFVFGFLDGTDEIPADVTRIAFLDSNYAYGAAKGHRDKFTAWLAGGAPRSLCVLAYHDSIALLNGKAFVSEDGGTWGRSRAMQQDLAAVFPFTTETADGFQRFTALDGRVKFILKENPAREVLHTRQVELNGFIHSMLTGTPLEEKEYRYFGPRVYSEFITDNSAEK
jgi:hypothetical protein